MQDLFSVKMSLGHDKSDVFMNTKLWLPEDEQASYF